LASVLREQVKAARHELDHHASVKMGSAVAADFAAEREALVAAFERLQDRTPPPLSDRARCAVDERRRSRGRRRSATAGAGAR
jgi:hypothetical protein